MSDRWLKGVTYSNNLSPKDIEIKELKEKVKRLNNIIKEVREFINESEDYFYNYPLVNREYLLFILDKVKEK